MNQESIHIYTKTMNRNLQFWENKIIANDTTLKKLCMI